MGKLVILSVTDHEEHIINKIMELIADEPEFIHLAPSPPQSALSFPGLEIRLKEQTVYCNSTFITLTYHEFAVLTYLARHPGWVFSAHQIYEAIWCKDGEHCGTAVSSVISQIRRKLTPDTPKGGYIRTVLGSGYKFNSSPFSGSKKGFETAMFSKPFLFFIRHEPSNSVNYNPYKNTGFRLYLNN